LTRRGAASISPAMNGLPKTVRSIVIDAAQRRRRRQTARARVRA
jgi:hypothetical protein